MSAKKTAPARRRQRDRFIDLMSVLKERNPRYFDALMTVLRLPDRQRSAALLLMRAALDGAPAGGTS